MNFQSENKNSDQHYATVTDAITALHQKGFTLDFCLLDNQLFCPQLKLFLSADEFEILEMHVFDAACCAWNENIVYAIACFSEEMRGILLLNCTHVKYAVHDIFNRQLRKFWKGKELPPRKHYPAQ